MNHQLFKTFGVAALIAQCVAFAACSSSASPTVGGQGGSTAGAAGTTAGTGGAGGAAAHIYPAHPGSCVDGADNPDFATGGACAPECQSVSCGTACSQDCCVTCGIDATGIKFCNCKTPGLAYANCTCAPPATIPPGLLGGNCMPQGDSRAAPPAGAGMIIRGMPCKTANLVCFTSDSMSTSERGCICQDVGDGTGLILHCGSVNKWFANNGVPTSWMP
jgi:hypothetical protein